MFDGAIEFKDRVIDNASDNEEIFNSFTGTTDASTCTQGFAEGANCVGNLGFNFGAIMIYVVFMAACVGLFFGVCKVAIKEGGWAALVAFIIAVIVGLALYFLPELITIFAGLLVSLQ